MIRLYAKFHNACTELRERIDDRGATAVEYVIMVTLIAVVLITGATLLGNKTNTNFKSGATAVH